ncbi:trigger factor [Methylomagnum ishizawai]|uniref:Trigger factor n=1 Tax=Methylomagnum ishizawai TaxID=1760988 RepID=A0A1Y6CU95_9GAMM|nr:trigger factor [Methylomagnum ishizawai]SMF93760.1 trigger factor [Methylomagnum ishizawai]
MQVSVETTSELSRKLTVQVPEEKIQKEVSTRLNALTQKVKLDGFRPGKAPHSVIKQRYGQQVREEVLTEIIQNTFHEAVRDEKLNPAGMPTITAHKADEGQGLEYEANFEVMPEFVPMPLETLEVRRYLSEVGDEDVDAMIQRLREQRKTWEAVERSSVEGDRMIIAFEGFDGEASFTNGKVEDFPVVLGEGQMVPGFEDNLKGATPGAKLEFDQAFPEDYPAANLAGKTVHFVVEVAKVEETRLPELDADFMSLFGIEGGEFDAFRAEIRSNMEREMRRALHTKTKTSVMDALYAANPIQLPGVLVKDEVNDLARPYLETAQERKQAIDEAKLKEQLEPVARRRVTLALVLNKLIETYNVKLDVNRVRAAVEELAQSYEQPSEVVRWYYSDKTRLREIENVTREDQVVDLILEQGQTTEEKIDFQALMQAAAPKAQA